MAKRLLDKSIRNAYDAQGRIEYIRQIKGSGTLLEIMREITAKAAANMILIQMRTETHLTQR